MSTLKARHLGATLVALYSAGCGMLANSARPDDPTAADAMGEKTVECGQVQEYADPLIVDLGSSERGDLELMMREGVVVVKYDCNGLRVLPDCRVDGTYGFMGYQTKEEVIRIGDKDELKANLPINAGAIGAKLGGELEREMSLDIALMLIGKHRTTRKSTSRGQLIEDRPGACKDSTHFVRGATLGAFAMATGTKAETRAAAEIFGIPKLGSVGASGSGSSEREVSTKDGELAACKTADPTSERPPNGCGSLLRLELTVIDEGGTPIAAAPDGPPGMGEEPELCPNGMVFSEGKCTQAKAGIAHRCRVEDQSDCVAQCDLGDAVSCSRAGYNHYSGANAPQDYKKAHDYFRKACDKDWALGCGGLASTYALGDGVAANEDKAAQYLTKACDLGGGVFCALLGGFYWTGNGVKKDHQLAAKYARLGCNGGAAPGCVVLANMYNKGQGGLSKDSKKSRQLFKQACDGQDPLGCMSYGIVLEEGLGGPKDVAGGQAIFKQLCDSKAFPKACGAVK